MSAKRKRVVLCLEKKVLIINRAVDHGESVQKLANEFGVGQQTVLCNAWENLPATTLRLSWAKILDQDYEDEENIEDTVNTDIKACLDLVISIPDFTNVDEDDIFDWLQKDLNEEGFERLSDSDIAVRYGSVSTPSTSQQPDSSSENDSEENFEKIQTSQAMEAVDVLLNFCEQENFDFHDIIGLRKIRSEVRKIISNQKKQRLITSYFMP
ncbi:hypothetical protein AGLY_016506 [Aphis glycines]|uniref:HTH psq-type domain-containing protein n=1 Tax=Aphis glycines TaxID=307491 RepID=A0A6G0SXH4_APHGL|nr:hypothetical protein AGLY_016506 [Aphis glycines]